MAKEKIIILEHLRTPLQRVNENAVNPEDRYVLVGPCADFTDGSESPENENGRVYEKDDYLDKIKDLIQEAHDLILFGSLDHPEDYMTSMKEVSHRIEDIWYDEKTKLVMIKIRLLPTEKGGGKDAMAVVDAGSPLFISSRASGYIDDDGKVTLEKIYSFDIVYRPGFKNAKLKRLNEKYHIKSKAVMILEWKDDCKCNFLNKSANNTKTPINMEYASKDDIVKINEGVQKFTEGMTKQMELITNALNGKGLKINAGVNFSKPKKMNENLTLTADDKVVINEMNQMISGGKPKNEAYTEVLAMYEVGTLSDMLRSELKRIAEVKDDDAASDDTAKGKDEKVDGLTAKLDDFKKENDGLIEYIEKAKELVNDHDDKIEGMGEFLGLVGIFCNKLADVVEALTEKIDAISEVVDLGNERVDDITDHAEEIVNEINGMKTWMGKMHNYANTVATRVNEVNQTVKTNKQGINDISKYANAIAENQNKLNIFTRKINENSKSGKATIGGGPVKINESILNTKGALTKKVDTILEAVKNQRTDRSQIILETQYPFAKLLNSNTMEDFSKLSEIKKKRILQKVNESKNVNAEKVKAIINEVKEDHVTNNVLTTMPKNIIPIWEKMNVVDRNKIMSLANIRGIRTSEEAESFWDSINLNASKIVQINEGIHELDNGALVTSGDTLGYSDDDIDHSLGLK